MSHQKMDPELTRYDGLAPDIFLQSSKVKGYTGRMFETNLLHWGSLIWESTLGSSHIWGLCLAIPLLVLGIVGIVVPILPGTLLIFAGCLGYAVCTQFTSLGWIFFLVQAFLVLVANGVDFVATAYGVKRFGGSKAAVWGAVLGSLLIFVIGPLGIIIGPLLGAILGELLMGEVLRKAMRAGWGSFLGFIGGTLVKAIISLVMIGYFFLSLPGA